MHFSAQEEYGLRCLLRLAAIDHELRQVVAIQLAFRAQLNGFGQSFTRLGRLALPA